MRALQPQVRKVLTPVNKIPQYRLPSPDNYAPLRAPFGRKGRKLGPLAQCQNTLETVNKQYFGVGGTYLLRQHIVCEAFAPYC